MDNLNRIAFYSSLSPANQSLLAANVSDVTCKSMDQVLTPGQCISGAYFVLDGLLRVYTLSPNGTQATLYQIAPGETCVFAINCLFNDLRYPAWVEAEAQTSVAFIAGDTYRQLFQTEPSVQDITINALSTAVFRLMTELEQVHQYDQTQRLSNTLLTRASASGEVKMTQQQLASHLGTTREVIAKLIGKLVAQQYIESHRGMILVKDITGLTQIITTIAD